MERRMRKNIIWNAFGNIVYLASQWIVTVMVTRLAGYEDAGVLSLAMSISATFQTIALFGIRNYQTSDIENKYSNSCYVSARIMTCFAALVLCMAFAVLNGYGLNQTLAILWFMLFRLAENFSDVLHGAVQKKGHLDIAGKAFAIKGVVIITAFAAGYFGFRNLNGGLFFMMLGSVAATVFYDLRVSRKIAQYTIHTDIKECFPLLKETLPLCVYMFIFSAISTVPKYILEKMCDETALGAYSSIFAPALLIQAFAGYIFVPFTGKFAELHENKNYKGFKSLTLKICGVLGVFAVAVFLLAYFLGDSALKLLFGESILEYTYMLMPILVCIFINSLFALFCMLSVVIRSFKKLLITCGISLLIACVSTPIFINSHGPNGASFGLLSATLFGSVALGGIVFHRERANCVKNHERQI